MRSLLYVMSVLAVIGLAFWAYRENYSTQKSLKTVSQLHREIGQEREKMAVLRAEWAYLNRPTRLRELAEINFGNLGLLPLTPEQFGKIDQVAFPEPELPPITSPIDLSAQIPQTGEAQQ